MSLIDSMQTLVNGIKANRGKRRQDLKNIKQASNIWHGKASTKVIPEVKEAENEG